MRISIPFFVAMSFIDVTYGKGSIQKGSHAACKDEASKYCHLFQIISRFVSSQYVCVCVCAYMRTCLLVCDVDQFILSETESTNLYIVMEYCDGGDLMKKISMQRGVMFTEEQVQTHTHHRSLVAP